MKDTSWKTLARWADNIKIKYNEMGWDGRRWAALTQDRESSELL